MFGFLNKRNKINAFWYKSKPNFGDALNVYIIEQLSGKKTRWVNPKKFKGEFFICVGSILTAARKGTTVWGSGLMYSDMALPEPPKKICAVRGPLTRAALLSQGIECPEVYGDPALLMPLLYKPEVKKQYKVGIIPHFVDKAHPWLALQRRPDVKIIDIQNKDIFAFIDEVNSCDLILSSSMHGLIIADAYKIPSLWIELSDNVAGEGFKFMDYYASIGRRVDGAHRVFNDTSLDDLIKDIVSFQELTIDLEKLLSSCPFIGDKLLEKYLRNVG